MKNGISEIKQNIDCSVEPEVETQDDNSIEDAVDMLVSDIDIRINKIMPLKDAKKMVERELITKVMDKVGSTYKAARILEVSQATIARKAKSYNDEVFDMFENN